MDLETAEQTSNTSKVTKYKWGEEVTISATIQEVEDKYGVFDGWERSLIASLGENYNSNLRNTVIVMPKLPIKMTAKAIYTDAPDTELPTWSYVSKTNSNTEYEDYANSTHDVSITFNGIDNNYVDNYLTANKIKIYVGDTEISPTVKTLSTATNIENGVQYTLSLSGLTGNGELKLKIEGNTLQDKSENFSEETLISTGIIIDNIAPNSPQIAIIDNGGHYSDDYSYSDYITYQITEGIDTEIAMKNTTKDQTTYANNELNILDAIGTIFMPISYAETAEPLAINSTIAKTYYKVTGAVTIDETLYSSNIKIELPGSRGTCTISAITYDKAGNRSLYATQTKNICGLHDADASHQEKEATCTEAEVLSHRCSSCYKLNDTYTGTAAKGHNYPCSGSNHKRSGGSVSIKCSRCTATKSYSVTNGTCTYWKCSCGKSGGYSSHTYSYSCSKKGGTVYGCVCSKCSYCGNCGAKH